MDGLNPTILAPNSPGSSSSVRRVRSLSDAVHTQTPPLSLDMEPSTSRRSDVGAIASSSISIPAPVYTREYFSVTHNFLREPPSLPSPITPTHVPLPASPATPVQASPWANMPTLGPLPEDDEPDTPVTTTGNLHDGGDVMGISLPRLRRILAFFGRGRSGSRKRRAMVSCIWTLSTGSIMLVVSIVLLAIAAHTKSKTVPGVSEWTACERPLGVWNVIWILKTVMSCWLAIWSWNIRTKSQSTERSSPSSPGPADAERPTISGPMPFAPGTDIHGLGQGTIQVGTDPTPPRPRRSRRIQVPPLFSRLTMFNTLLGVTWFVTAHILVYTSLNTCRYSSPHLWWLTFGILCVVYLSIAEVILIAVGFFVLAPIVFITLNLVLLVLGRHPLQNPYQIKPTVGKLPKGIVERIPLVMYIPSPPEPEANGKSEAGADGIQTPAAAYQYPPTQSTSEKGGKKRRFRFALLRRRKRNGSSKAGSANEEDEDAEPTTWEGNWVRSELPYVRLEANRATCAICLMDFAEPPRVKGSRLPPLANGETGEAGAAAAAGDGSEGEVRQVPRGDETSHPVEGQVEVHQDGDHLHLTDAGEEAQPLRLLACGHAFHQTCLDPWLTDVSGRCPVCQRPVEVAPIPPKLRGGRWRRRNRNTDVEAPPAE